MLFFSTVVNQTSAGVTIVKVDGATRIQEHSLVPLIQPMLPSMSRVVPAGRPRLGDSRSTGRLSSALHMNRSMTKLNAGQSIVNCSSYINNTL
jgi:hypothetical protein